MNKMKEQIKQFVSIGSLCMMLLTSGQINAQSAPAPKYNSVEPIAMGNFNQWVVREIEESAILGGNKRLLYEVAPTDTVIGNIAYKANPKSPWATSNVMANVGVTKTSVTVFPEKRDNGQCARLETRMETCKVLGIVNITVLASGTLFLGEVQEPIKSTKNPQSKLAMGVPFTKRPKALLLDYKMKVTGDKDRIKATGFSKISDVPGEDFAEITILLQKRWEDADGNIFAKRVGTGSERIHKTTPNWINEHPVEVLYGDIRSNAKFKPQMQLYTGDDVKYAKNKAGKVVPIQEVGWADANEQPTHLMVQISSSHGGAYIGSPGNTIWVDNVKLAY